MERINLLKKYLDQAANNLLCYSKSLLMTEPKPGFEKEWNEALEEVRLLETMVNADGSQQNTITSEQENAARAEQQNCIKTHRYSDLFESNLKWGFNGGCPFVNRWLAKLEGRMTELECRLHNYVIIVGTVQSHDQQLVDILNEFIYTKKDILSFQSRLNELFNRIEKSFDTEET